MLKVWQLGTSVGVGEGVGVAEGVGAGVKLGVNVGVGVGVIVGNCAHAGDDSSNSNSAQYFITCLPLHTDH